VSSKVFKISVLLGLMLLFAVIVWISDDGRDDNIAEIEPEEGEQMLAQESVSFEPAYMALHRTGELRKRGEKLWAMMEGCRLCPRNCGINRLEGETGICRAPGTQLYVASAHAHFGEERPLVGWGGSGTIFFSHCALRCVFCINWDISHEGSGGEVSVEELAEVMMKLQQRGVHNINLVTPNHYVAHIVKAIDVAAGKGLRLPIVFNTCGFVPIEVLRLLDGIVDIYLPDIKFFSAEVAGELAAGATSYPEVVKEAIIEMNRQVGVAKPGDDGIMKRGLMIRHLVMPNDKSGSVEIMEWIAQNLPSETYINIMSQYRPSFRAHEFEQIARAINRDEYREVVERAQELGLTNLDIQGFWWLEN
jgi:putative pyruvate formate lyase activating enzyme